MASREPSVSATREASPAAPPRPLPGQRESTFAGEAGQPLSLADYEPLARRRLPRALFGYIAGACEENWSRDENRAAFHRVTLMTRVLRDVSARDCSTELFGKRWAAPFGIAPMGIAALMAYRGDLALAKAAQAEGVPMMMSAASLIPLEDVVAVAPDTWFQAYLPADTDWIDPMVDRIARAGYGTMVLTVDVPTAANRENLVKTGFATPLQPSIRLALDGVTHPVWLWQVFARTLLRHGMPAFVNAKPTGGEPIISRTAGREFGQRDRLTWDSVAYIRSRWSGNLIVKGILHPADAEAARAVGADGIIVSNHGGRQLDGTPATIDALPDVLATAGAMPVMIDGGFRRGSDVMKAIALGARMAFVGRPFMYAAAIDKEAGVRHAIDLLRAEIHRNMAMMGLTSVDQLDASCLRVGT